MLNDQEALWLMQQLAATAELLDKAISPVAVEMMAGDPEHYPRAVLAAALSRVRTKHTGKLTTKAVIDRIDAVMGRPDANEAWATALQALDERNTVVWMQEMAQAWEVARPLVKGGDEIGGRMTFRDAYERLVRTAREERRVPVPFVSLGQESDLRAVGIEKAVKLGYLSPGEAALYLPAPKTSVIDPLLLLAGQAEIPAGMPPEVCARFRQLRDELATAKARRIETMARRATDAAADLIARKARAQALADDYTALVDEAAALRAAVRAAA